MLVRIEAASICGTDLHINRWDQWSSRARAPAADARPRALRDGRRDGERAFADVAEGDYVSAESHVTCGTCFHCRTGKAHMCERTQILGVDRDGGFADYVAVPASVIWQNDRTKLPPEIACLQEPFGNAVFATCDPGSRGPRRRRARVRAGRALHHRDRHARSGQAASSPPTTCPSGSSCARALGADDVVERRRGRRTSRRGSPSTTRAWAWASSSRCRARCSAIEDAFGIVRHGGNVVLFGIPAQAGDDRHRRVAHLQEPHRERGQRARDLGDVVHDALAARARRRRPAAADHRASFRSSASRRRFALLETGEACKIVLRPNGAGR